MQGSLPQLSNQEKVQDILRAKTVRPSKNLGADGTGEESTLLSLQTRQKMSTTHIRRFAKIAVKKLESSIN